MSKKKEYQQDEAHRPFAVLLASKPPSQGGKARSSMISLVLHGVLITAFVYVTSAVAEEVTQDEDEIIVEFAPEVNVPPPPPPPPPPELSAPELQDFKGFQTLELPKLIPPDIPPPASMAEFRASDFSGEGVAGGRGSGSRIADSTVSEVRVSRETPSFTPMTIRPRLTNTDEVQRALVREYPPILRDAGIGGTVEVWLYIDQNGKVENVKVNKGSGYAQLDEAALKVGATMTFTPAYNRDLKVPVWVSIPITFKIG